MGMWHAYAKELGISLKASTISYGGVDSDLTMFFVGDAAGRMMGHATGRAKDHADSDRYGVSLCFEL